MPTWEAILTTDDLEATPTEDLTTKTGTSEYLFDWRTLYNAHIVNYGLHAKVVRKTALQTINNSTTLINDDHLLLAVGIDEVWLFQLFCIHDFSSAADLDVSFTVPANATVLWGEPSVQPSTKTAGQELFIAGSAKDSIIQLQGIVVVGDTAGNLQFQWAQNAAIVTDCRVEANSVLIATQLV